MKKTNVLLIALFAISCLAVPISYANPMGGGDGQWNKKHERFEKKTQEIYAQLNLTEDQKKQLEENKTKNRGNKKEMFEKMRNYKEALNKELMKPELDMNKINEIQSQFKTMQSQMIDERLNSVLEVRKILTPEQFTKFITLMEKQHKHGVPGEEKGE